MNITRYGVEHGGQRISVASGNSKLASFIANVSFPPIVTCRKGVPCAKGAQGCYIIPAFNMYENTRDAYRANLTTWNTSIAMFRSMVNAWLRKYPRAFFRINVSGDWRDVRMLRTWLGIAIDNPHTMFVAYTKVYGPDFPEHMAIYANLPANLIVRASTWPGLPDNAGDMPRAYLDNGPSGTFVCTGKCGKTCMHCYTTRDDVILPKG